MLPGRSKLVAAFALACLCGSAHAHAQSNATHALLELELGASLTGDGGPAAAVAMGIGGMLRGFPARFYLLGRFASSSYAATSQAALAPFGQSVESGAFQDLSLGPRVYWPLFGGLRWYFEATLGASYVSGRYQAPERATLRAQQWLGLATVATGLQLRLLPALSLGMRGSFAFNEPGLTGVMRSAGVHAAARSALMGGVTWHF